MTDAETLLTNTSQIQTRPIRFGVGAPITGNPRRLIDAAKEAEDSGFSTFNVSDHLGLPFAPLIAAQAIADATSTLRLGQLVLDQDFRHPAILAKELATLDVFSGGRIEVGLGAGWMEAEYKQIGLAFDPASSRIRRLEETISVLKGVFGNGRFHFTGEHFRIADLEGKPKTVQRPHPPILVGGNGPKLLAAAARGADIIQITGRSAGMDASGSLSSELAFSAFQDKIELIKAEAGPRFHAVELAIPLYAVEITNDVHGAVRRFISKFGSNNKSDRGILPEEEILASPVVAFGTLDAIREKILTVRGQLGISYFNCPWGMRASAFTPIVEGLRGM